MVLGNDRRAVLAWSGQPAQGAREGVGPRQTRARSSRVWSRRVMLSHAAMHAHTLAGGSLPNTSRHHPTSLIRHRRPGQSATT